MTEKIQEYLLNKSIERERAAECYRLPLERFSQFFKKNVEETSRQDITQFHLYLKNNFEKPTVNYTMRVVRNFLNYYDRPEAKKIILKNYISSPHEEVKEFEYKKMLEVWSTGEFWQTEKIVIIRMLWDTGMRVSELCDLDISQITQQRKTEIFTKKNGKPRLVKWSEKTHLFLMKYLGVRLCMNQQPHLFLSERKGRVATRTVERWIRLTAKKAGITRHIVCHSFRHAKAMNILRKKGNLLNVARQLGHSELNPIAVFHYLRQFTKEEEEAELDRFIDVDNSDLPKCANVI